MPPKLQLTDEERKEKERVRKRLSHRACRAKKKEEAKQKAAAEQEAIAAKLEAKRAKDRARKAKCRAQKKAALAEAKRQKEEEAKMEQERKQEAEHGLMSPQQKERVGYLGQFLNAARQQDAMLLSKYMDGEAIEFNGIRFTPEKKLPVRLGHLQDDEQTFSFASPSRRTTVSAGRRSTPKKKPPVRATCEEKLEDLDLEDSNDESVVEEIAVSSRRRTSSVAKGTAKPRPSVSKRLVRKPSPRKGLATFSEEKKYWTDSDEENTERHNSDRKPAFRPFKGTGRKAGGSKVRKESILIEGGSGPTRRQVVYLQDSTTEDGDNEEERDSHDELAGFENSEESDDSSDDEFQLGDDVRDAFHY